MGMVFLLRSMNVFTKAVGLGNSSWSGAAAVCGNVTIPYPFGIEPGCYIDDWFAIDCNYTLVSPKPIISLEGTLRVNYPMSWICANGLRSARDPASLASSPFVISKLRNIFIAMGCDNFAYLQSDDFSLGIICGCMSVCEKNTLQTNSGSCNGIGCCKATIPSDLDLFTKWIAFMYKPSLKSTKDCSYASLVDQKLFEENLTNFFEVRNMSHVPVVLNWEINANLSSLIMGSNSSHSTCQFANGSSLLGNVSSTFTFTCDSGFEGNPYVLDGCQGKLLALY